MPLTSLCRLPMAMGQCKYLRGSCSVICCGKSWLERNFRQLSASATLSPSPLVVPLFVTSNGSSLAYFPAQNHYGYRNRSFSVDVSNGGPVSNEERWEIRFQDLVEYKREFGHTIVPQNYPNNPQLSYWVKKQLVGYKRKQSGQESWLIDELMSYLNEIGFVWDPYDEAWKEMFQQLNEYTKEHGDTLVPKKYPDNPQLGMWVDRQRQNRKRNKLAQERVVVLDGIGFVWDALEAAWEEMFQQLIEYTKEHGDTLVPEKYPDNPQLGMWVDKQRQNRKRNKLAQERVVVLDGIGFVWDANEAAWEEMFHRLRQYKKEFGNTLVPNKYPGNPQLGIWVETQRQNRKRDKLAPERVVMLDGIGFVWDANEAAWEEIFQQLKQYKDEHGDTLVPAKYHDNPQLGTWVNTQRRHFKLKQRGEDCSLTDERISRLNRIGFVWDALEAAWEEMFHQLVDYMKEHGDALVPYKYPDNPQLGKWVDTQRQNRKRNKLAQERVEKLNEIGFVWDANEATWKEMFQQLKEFKDGHGTALVPAKYPDNPQLGMWVDTQRQNRKNNKLAPERVEKLDEIDFVWDAHEAAWQSNYNKLYSFYKRYGHTRIPLQGRDTTRSTDGV